MGIGELKPRAENLRKCGEHLTKMGPLQQMRDGPALVLATANLLVEMAERIDAMQVSLARCPSAKDICHCVNEG